MRMTDDEFRDKAYLTALGGLCLQCAPDYMQGSCNAAIVERASILADLSVKNRKNEIAKSHGMQEE